MVDLHGTRIRVCSAIWQSSEYLQEPVKRYEGASNQYNQPLSNSSRHKTPYMDQLAAHTGFKFYGCVRAVIVRARSSAHTAYAIILCAIYSRI